MKRKKIASIDVGTSKICTVMADTDGESLRILGVGIAPSNGMQKGHVVNLNDTKDAIRQSVRTAEQAVGYRLDSATVNISGRNISSLNNRGVIAITSNKQIVKVDDIQRVMTVAQNVDGASTAGSTILHLIPQTYTVDGQEGIKNPVGMHGFRLDVDTHIVTAPSAAVENFTKCIRSAGIEIEQLVFSPLASAAAAVSADERQNGVIMADIGGGTTDITIYRDDSIMHTSVLPVSGYSISHDISVGLGVSIEMAEELKLKYGSVIPGDDKSDNRALTEGGRVVPYAELYEIIRTRVEEMLRLIMLELPSDYNRYIRAGVVLTGGTANLPGITELGLEVTHMPVRVGMPPKMYGIADNLMDPAFSTAVGLLVWKQGPKETPKEKDNNPSGLGGLFGRKQ
ncbi:MAG: cell division protein FtsA [Dehalococcoidia bacterium]|nr:cell division protein FtsA [Dehalococcoidia bacterium]